MSLYESLDREAGFVVNPPKDRRDEIRPAGDLSRPNGSRPSRLKCAAPSCSNRIVSYLTDRDVELAHTLHMKDWSEAREARILVRKWYCSEACLYDHLDHLHARSAIGSTLGEAAEEAPELASDEGRTFEVAIAFDREHVPAVRDGDKWSTLQYAFGRDLDPGQPVLLHDGDRERFATAEILRVKHAPLEAFVGIEIPGHRSYATEEELVNHLSKYYPEAALDPRSRLTWIAFDVLEVER